MIHDIAITERYALCLTLPVLFDLDAAMGARHSYRWFADYDARRPRATR